MKYEFDPRIKLIFILLATTCSLVISNVWYQLLIAAITFMFTLVFRGDLFGLFKRLKHFVQLILFVVLMQMIFQRQGEALIVIRNITVLTVEGLNESLKMCLRFFTIFACAAIMAAQSNRFLIQALIQMKVPYLFAFMLSTALRFLPYFSESYVDSMTSIQLRGLDIKKVPLTKKIKVYSYLLFPNVADAVVKSQDLSIAMTARGFGAYKKRTSLYYLKLRGWDYGMLAIILIIFSSIIVKWRIL